MIVITKKRECEKNGKWGCFKSTEMQTHYEILDLYSEIYFNTTFAKYLSKIPFAKSFISWDGTGVFCRG